MLNACLGILNIMTITRSGRAVINEGGPTPQNVRADTTQILINEARGMMHGLLDKQRREFIELFVQKLANARGRAPMVNAPIIFEQVNNRPIPSHLPMVQEGNNDSESYQRPLLF